MHKQTVLAWCLFALIALVVPTPYGAPHAECFKKNGHAPGSTFIAYVDGRPFFATYPNKADALTHAQNIGACVENFGITVEYVQPLRKWALRFKKRDGYAVFGTHPPKTPDDYFRLVWKDRVSGEVHHSQWFAQGLRNATDDVEVFNRIRYKDDFVFWIEIAL